MVAMAQKMMCECQQGDCTRSQVQYCAVKCLIDRLMGRCIGDGVGPTVAAEVVRRQYGVDLTPEMVWHVWLEDEK